MIVHAKEQISAAFAAEVGILARERREMLGLRQDELALAAGVSTRVVHQIEHGKATSRLDSLLAVLDALGLALEVGNREEQGQRGA